MDMNLIQLGRLVSRLRIKEIMEIQMELMGQMVIIVLMEMEQVPLH